MESPSSADSSSSSSQCARKRKKLHTDAHAALSQTGDSKVSAQDRSVVYQPQLTGVQAQRDVNLTVNNTYVQPAATTDDRRDVSPNLSGNLQKCQTDLKSYLKSTTTDLFQGTDDEQSIPLNRIYTELYISEGGSGEVNAEHEVLELECKRPSSEENKVHLHDIFKALPNEWCPQRVLTKGIAGIGKTVAVWKFTYDWAAGEANQDFHFIFPFTFRDLNLEIDKCWSLVDLLGNYFTEVKELDISNLENSSILFIFDGLDESKFHLDFNNNKMCRDVKKPMNINVLLTNLIGGKLLPKASVWITSRPAATSRITLKFNRVTEVRGFNDEQKVEYFQKKIKDEKTAQKILEHLQSKSMRSLYIMCHIPIFCWISAMVLESLITESKNPPLPKTITEMYTHFLIILIKLRHNKRYQKGEPDKEMIMKLGRLAFEQLKEGNIIFYEEDLESCEIDVEQAAVCSGVCTQIIRKESGLHKREIYSFVHLSVQEFLAALYILETFIEKGQNLFCRDKKMRTGFCFTGEEDVMHLYTEAVDKALDSSYGQWDLFLRFLLGLSQDENQDLLQKDFGFGRPQLPKQKIIEYIHLKIKNLTNPDKSINLFHCLNELDDQSLIQQVRMYLRSRHVHKILLEHWSALAFALLISDTNLDVFDLWTFHRSDDVLERMLPVLKVSKTALLSNCKLTKRCCGYISSVLSKKSSALLELDLSRNQLQDSGIILLCNGLKSPECKLQRLSLYHCSFTEVGCKSLVEALKSNPFHMKDLNLSFNRIGDEAVVHLCSFLKHPDCQLQRLRLYRCGFTEVGCKSLADALYSKPSPLKYLDLSYNSIGDKAVVHLCSFLKHPGCQLQRLRLFETELQKDGAAALASALASDTSHLVELDLGGNWKLGDDGLMEICALLKNPNCKLEELGLYRCGFAEVGCKSLADALYSKPSPLKYLDLSFNSIGDKAVVHLCSFLKHPGCQLQRLSLVKCWVSEIGCSELVSSLRLNPAHLRDLDLGLNVLQDRGVEVLSEFLADPLCQLNTLRLNCCDVTAVGCRSLSSALRCSSSSLKKLDLSGNLLTNEEIELLSDWQRRPECTLKY